MARSQPDRLWAATSDGVFYSGDGGRSWSLRSPGLDPGPIDELSSAPEQPDHLVAARFDPRARGAWRTTDGGLTWHPIAALGSHAIRHLHLDATGSRLLAAVYRFELRQVGGHLFEVAVGGGLLLSTDGEETTTPANEGLASLEVSTLASAPDDAFLLAGTRGLGVFASSSYGMSWRTVHGPSVSPLEVSSLAIASPLQLYAATRFDGAFRSADGGHSWQRMPIATTHGRVGVIALDPSIPGTLYAGSDRGVAISEDSGASWRPLGSLMGEPTDLVFGATGRSTLFAASELGLFARDLAGAGRWTRRDDGLTNAVVRDFAVLPGSPSSPAATPLWLLASQRGLDLSPQGQPTLWWRNLEEEPLISLAASGPDLEKLWIVTAAGTLHRGPSGAAIPLGDGPRAVHAQVVRADPRAAGTVLVGTAGHGVLRSTDQGRSWRRVDGLTGHLAVHSLGLDPDRTDLVLAGGDRGRLLRSRDGGRRWTALAPVTGSVLSLAAAPGQPSTLYAGTRGQGIFVSEDGGATWTQRGDGIRVYALATLRGRRDTIFAGTHVGVFRSDDRGLSWRRVEQGPAGRPTRVLTRHPGRPDALLAGTDHGLWVLIDGKPSR